MTEDQALDFLSQGTHTGKLATSSRGGAPHVAPIWFIIDGRDLVFSTDRDSVKGHHLLANPRAGLTVDVEEFPYHFVSVSGPVEIDEHPRDMIAWSTRIAERYVPRGRADEYGRRNAEPGALLCRLRPERIVGVRDIAVLSGTG